MTIMRISDEALRLMPRAQLKALMPLTPAQLDVVKVHVRSQGRCGSLQTGDGLPCLAHPRYGWTVCGKHGERAPKTTAKAERLLAVARMPAIEWILDALDRANDETCDACGLPKQSLKEQKRLDMLAFRLLDRTGFGPHSKIELGVSNSGDSDGLVENMTPEEREQLRALLTQVRALKDRVRYRLASDVGRQARDIIEAEVVAQAALPAGPTDSNGQGD